MKSPFPGMDPYLETHWRDVHQRLCIYACDTLQVQIRPTLLARVDKRLVVEADEYERSIYPDVTIIEDHPGRSRFDTPSATGIAEPLRIILPDDAIYDGYIKIVDPANGNKIITVVEFLSVSNKEGNGADQYRIKQKESIKANISIVEIDLLREGKWVLAAEESLIPIVKRQPYRASIRRSWEHGPVDYYHFPIQERLPKIRIPLREEDQDALLDLQQLIDQTYLNGAYDSINYTVPPAPPFAGELAAWSRELTTHRAAQ